MSLKVLHPGISNSLYVLDKTGFTKTNTPEVAGEKAPYGVLGGSVAALAAEGEYVSVAGNGQNFALGLFKNNAEGAPYDNSPAEASGKVAIVLGNAAVETDIYSHDVTFALGDALYSDANGYLTNVESANKQVIGHVTKLPTAKNPFLGVQLV